MVAPLELRIRCEAHRLAAPGVATGFVETGTDYSACRLKVALHQKSHGDGGSVPTARRQSPKEAFSRGADSSRWKG